MTEDDRSVAPDETIGDQLVRSLRPDRRRSDPLWHQVEEALRSAVGDGSLPVGAQLPSEGRLSELLGVSRITTRHALANLETQGVVRRDHGRGTFVRSPRLTAGQRGLTSLSQELTALGLDAETRLLELGQVAAGDDIAAELEIDASTMVWRVHRLRLAGGEEIGVQTAFLRVDRVPVLDADILDGASLYEVLHRDAGIEPLVATETYRVGAAGTADAETLKIAAGDPVFTILRVTTDRIGPFEMTFSTMRGDRYEISSTLRTS